MWDKLSLQNTDCFIWTYSDIDTDMHMSEISCVSLLTENRWGCERDGLSVEAVTTVVFFGYPPDVRATWLSLEMTLPPKCNLRPIIKTAVLTPLPSKLNVVKCILFFNNQTNSKFGIKSPTNICLISCGGLKGFWEKQQLDIKENLGPDKRALVMRAWHTQESPDWKHSLGLCSTSLQGRLD